MGLIWSTEEIERFYALLPPLEEDEAFFLSLSARNKYLTLEERTLYDLGRSEMFGRKLVTSNSVKRYLAAVRQYDCPGGWLTRSELEIPSKCMVVYANINPLNGRKALFDFQRSVLDHLEGTKPDPSFLKNVVSRLHNSYQRSRARKVWIDVDFDAPKDVGLKMVREFVEHLSEHGATYWVISTAGGYHVLVKDIHFNYTPKVSELNLWASKGFGGEVMVNRNDMVPLPGTRQADFNVTLWSALEVEKYYLAMEQEVVDHGIQG